MELTNNNKLIAKFMGHEPIVKGDDVYYELNHIRLTSADDLRYHNSWDWLMPVVYKILWLEDYEEESYEDIHNGLTNALIGQTYDAVVEFIKEWPHPPYTDLDGNTYI